VKRAFRMGVVSFEAALGRGIPHSWLVRFHGRRHTSDDLIDGLEFGLRNLAGSRAGNVKAPGDAVINAALLFQRKGREVGDRA
jgi:hypothetical protein